MRKFFKEFKDFISRGNIVDLAVAVIIGGAFSAIVTALTDKIIRPLINWVLALCLGSKGFESAYTILKAVYTNGELDLTKSIYIDWGAFIAAIINFLIIAFTIFCIVKAINNSTKKIKELKSSIKSEASKSVREEKKMIRLKAEEEGRSFKEAWAEHLALKQKEEEETLKLEAEEKARLEEEEKKLHPSQEELLKEIRDLLVNLNNSSSKPTKTTKSKK